MNTCGTCKYRGANINDEVPTTFFLCDLIKHNNRMERDLGEAKGEHAAVVDGSGYYAALCVEEDFGCNRWEPK